MEESAQGTKRKGRGRQFSGRMGRFIKRHRKLFITLLVLIVLAVAALVVVRTFFGGSPAAGVSIPETTMLSKMDLELVVTATGTLQSAEVYDVDSDLSYKVAEIYVAEGDKVTAGQPLALLDDSDLEESIADLQDDIAEAASEDVKNLEKMAKRLQEAIGDRDANYADNTDAINKADDAVDSAKSAESSAKKKLSSATGELEDKIKKYLTPTGISKKAYQKIRSADDLTYYYDKYYSEDDPETTDEDESKDSWFSAAMGDIRDAITIYLTRYSDASRTAQEASAAVESAEAEYDKAVNQRDSDYEMDTSSIETAQENYDEQTGKDSTKDLREQLADLIEERADLTVYAPAAGTVTTIAAEVGKSAGGSSGGTGAAGGTGTAVSSSMFTLQNLSALEIPISIAEYDAISLRVGMSATITSDAVDDAEWTGIVDSISPVAADGYFTVTVALSSQPEQLTTGMSTTVDIITESASDVYAVPFDAVTTNAQGQTVVYALDLGGGGMPNFSGEMPGSGIEMPEGFSGEMPEGFSPEDMPEGFGGRGEREAPDADSTGVDAFSRTEIVVTTGLETDYYIEISGDGLYDGLAIINDPLGNSVSSTVDMGGMGQGGFAIGGMGGGGMPGGGGGAPPDGGMPGGGMP